MAPFSFLSPKSRAQSHPTRTGQAPRSTARARLLLPGAGVDRTRSAPPGRAAPLRGGRGGQPRVVHKPAGPGAKGELRSWGRPRTERAPRPERPGPAARRTSLPAPRARSPAGPPLREPPASPGGPNPSRRRPVTRGDAAPASLTDLEGPRGSRGALPVSAGAGTRARWRPRGATPGTRPRRELTPRPRRRVSGPPAPTRLGPGLVLGVPRAPPSLPPREWPRPGAWSTALRPRPPRAWAGS